MAEYHTTYRGPEGRTTEWDDIQIKMGNKAPRPKREKAPKFAGEYEEAQDSDWVRRLDEDELSDIEDDLEDDRALKVLRYYSHGLAVPHPTRCTHKQVRASADSWTAHPYAGSSASNSSRKLNSNRYSVQWTLSVQQTFGKE